MIKVIVFDFDGTIMDTNAIIIDSLNETAKNFRGNLLTEEELEKILGRALHEQVDMIMDGDTEAMVEFYRQYYRAHQDSMVHLFDGMKDLLEDLKRQGIPCSILTNKGRNGLENALKKFDLTAYFDYYLSAYDIENAKPHPEGLFKIAEHYGVKAEELLMVGDSAHDIEAGKAANAYTALVSWTILNKNKLKTLNPDIILSQAHDLLDYLKQNA